MNEQILIYLLSFLYIANLIVQLLGIKAIKLNYELHSEIFITFSYSFLLPLFFIYFIVKNPKFDKYGALCGIIDFVQLFLSVMSINYLTMGEYLTYRTSAIFFTSILSFYYLKKEITLLKKIGIGFIFIACVILLTFSNLTNIGYSLLCLFSSFLYATMGFIIEKYSIDKEKRDLNFFWTKIISNSLNLLLGFIFQLKDNEIKNSISILNNNFNLTFIIFLMLFLSLSENSFYLNKVILINKFEHNNSGSFYTGILDIIRRIITFIISLMIFNENYSTYIYVSYSIMLIGCILSIINIKKRNYENFDNLPQQIEIKIIPKV